MGLLPQPQVIIQFTPYSCISNHSCSVEINDTTETKTYTTQTEAAWLKAAEVAYMDKTENGRLGGPGVVFPLGTPTNWSQGALQQQSADGCAPWEALQIP